VEPILSSPNTRIRNLTIHVPQLTSSAVKNPLGSLPSITTVENLTISSSTGGHHLIDLDYIHNIVKKFPNLESLKGVSVSENEVRPLAVYLSLL
jgi:hypothetical protein